MSDSFPLFGVMRWNSSELAEALLLTPQRINQLSKENIIPQASDGLYTPVESVASYIRYLRQREAGKSQAGEAVKKVQLENAMREIKLRKIAGELVPVLQVQKDFFEMGRRVRDGLLNLPSRLSGPFAAEPCQEKIFDSFSKEIHAVLMELSSKQFSAPQTARLPLQESTQPEQAPAAATAHDVPDDGGLARPPAASQPPGEVSGPAESNDSKFEKAFLDRGDDDPDDRFSMGD